MSNKKTPEEVEFNFDKFVSDITDREDTHKEKIKEYAEDQDTLPQRRYNKLYRERPQNRVVWQRRGNKK